MLGEKTVTIAGLHQAGRTLLAFGIAIGAALSLGGCSGSISSVAVPTSSELLRSYDDTLSPSQRKDAIAELKREQTQASAEN